MGYGFPAFNHDLLTLFRRSLFYFRCKLFELGQSLLQQELNLILRLIKLADSCSSEIKVSAKSLHNQLHSAKMQNCGIRFQSWRLLLIYALKPSVRLKLMPPLATGRC